MKRLILMRHAKSDWSQGPSSDHDRPLNPRGRKACAALGRWLRDNSLLPDAVYLSTSMRTRETCVRLDLPAATQMNEIGALYLATPDTVLKTLRQAQGDCVLMIGHNPGIGDTANGLVTRPPDHPQFARYPTGATLVAYFDIDSWSDVKWDSAKASLFVVPREL